MIAGFRGTFVISWTQTELDGLTAAPMGALAVGATWRWHGEAIRVDGPGEILVLGPSEEASRLRRRAAKSVHRLVQVALNQPEIERVPDADDPVLDRGFAVTDGARSYTATIVEAPGSAPLLMFLGAVPPTDADLWITHVADHMLHAHRSGDAAPHVICFTPATQIATPDGPKRVADLREDDLVLTKDNGPQPIQWIGTRRISGARLYAMPELRPIRIRAGAVGTGIPDEDLLVSPGHRMLIKGPQAQALYGTDEVLVQARDLLNDHSIIRDKRVAEVRYVHLLMEHHQILFANGLESESFHPASMPRETMMPEHQAALRYRLPDIGADGAGYGAFARRSLSPAEAAIMMQGA